MRMLTVQIRRPLLNLCAALGVTLGVSQSSTAASEMQTEIPTQDELRQELASIGLSPEILCIAGLTAVQTTTVVTEAFDTIIEHWSTLEPARQAVSVKRYDIARLQALVARGVATSGDHAELATAYSELATAKSALNGVLSDIRSDIHQELDSEQLAIVNRLIQNADLPVPMEFRVLDHTAIEWVQFRKAYLECQTSPEPSSEATGLLHACDTDYSVSLARTRMGVNLTSVTAAFLAAIEP